MRGIGTSCVDGRLSAWQAHWLCAGPEETLLFYCPDCADREFGTDK
jgi:hypothetical protein